MSDYYVISGVLTGVLAAIIALLLYDRQRRTNGTRFKRIGEVSGLRVYPVKSCRGIDLNEAECGYMGIKYDRQFVILDKNHRPVTQRTRPKLALIQQTIIGLDLRLSAEGMTPICISLSESEGQTVTKQKISIEIFGLSGDGVLVNEELNKWISEFLNEDGHQIFRFPTGGTPRALRYDRKFSAGASDKDVVAFADKCPYLLLSEGSLQVLNSHFTDREMTMSRFRPNIIIRGCQPFEEDRVTALQIGTAQFRGLHRCGRCILTTVDPETSVKDPEEPLKTLRQFRCVPKHEDPRFQNSPVFGKNLGVEIPGIVRVGDEVYAVTS